MKKEQLPGIDGKDARLFFLKHLGFTRGGCPVLENLKSLKDDMVNKDWTITSFLFKYKNIEYIVLVKRFVNNEIRKDKYALVKLHFMKSDDLSYELELEANSSKLIVDAKILREYFGIAYSENLGDILRQFTTRLGNSIPITVPDEVTEIEKTAMVKSLSRSDSEDPNKIYCNGVKRNSNGRHRTPYNSDKTKLLRPGLYKHFSNELNISFCYFTDPAKENNDETILKNFSVKRE